MKRLINVAIGCLFCMTSYVLTAQTKIDLKSIETDLKVSVEKLSKHRGSVSTEKIEISGKLTSIQAQLLEKRRKARLLEMSNADRKVVMAKLEGIASQTSREVEYLGKQLDNLRAKQVLALFKGEKSTPHFELKDDSILERMKALEGGIDRLELLMGGAVVDAEVADKDGKIQQGKLASFGPAAWFVNSAGDVMGAVEIEPASRNAKLIHSDNADIAKLIQGEEVSVAVDLTGGKARALASISNSFADLVKKGGSWVWPIMLIALISIICAIMKFFQLSQIKNPKSGWLSGLLEHIREGNITAAQAACDEVKHPIGLVLRNALTGYDKGADVVEEIIYEQMIDVQSSLQHWLPFIAVTAAVGPLLGLLGTVSGMITTFNGLSVVGTGDPKLLSGGISEALITTLFGLVVAIPALILHSLLSRKSQGITQATEKFGLTVVNSIRKNK